MLDDELRGFPVGAHPQRAQREPRKGVGLCVPAPHLQGLAPYTYSTALLPSVSFLIKPTVGMGLPRVLCVAQGTVTQEGGAALSQAARQPPSRPQVAS